MLFRSGIVNLVQESYGGALVLFLTPVTEAPGAKRRVLEFCLAVVWDLLGLPACVLSPVPKCF